jgi:hypothetical protein
MTLDEAIKHCEEKAEEIRKANEEMPTDCKLSEELCECAREHEQLAGWLKELKALRGDCEYKGGKILKRMSGDYVTYKIEYLLDNLAREIYLLESSRKWKESKIKEAENDRDCEHCAHYVKAGLDWYCCESWECEFKPKGDEKND